MTFDAWALPPDFDIGRVATEEHGVPSGDAKLRWLLLGEDRARSLLDALRRGGEALRDVPVSAVVETVGAVGERLGDAAGPLGAEALSALPAHAGVSPQQARRVLRGMSRDWTVPRMQALLADEFADPSVLDRFVARPVPGGAPDKTRRLRAWGPALGVHVCSGSVPGVAIGSLIRGLLVKGPVLLKPGAGDALLPVLFARALATQGEVGRRLAAAVAVLYWPGGRGEAERLALAAADVAVVYGGDETVREVRSRLAPGARLVAHPHRVGFAVVGREAWTDKAARLAASDLAGAVAAFDQRGCVCPGQVVLPGASAAEAAGFGRLLSDALAELHETLPPGPVSAAEASVVQQVRGTAEIRASDGDGVTLFSGSGVSWTVIVDVEARLAEACASRTLQVTPVADVAEVARLLEPARDRLQSVGVAGLTRGEEADLAGSLGRLGVCRLAPIDELAFPPLWWRHDGREVLTSLVRWSEWIG